jgi:hypothetical protein
VLGDAGRLIVQTILHTTNSWILVPVHVSDYGAIDLVLDTGSPLSAISAQFFARLTRSGSLDQIAPNRFRLKALSIQGQRIADLTVRVSPRVTAVGADGVLGLDFLTRFREIRFDVPSLVLTLTP